MPKKDDRKKTADLITNTSDHIYRTLIESLPQNFFYKDLGSIYVFCNKKYADDLKTTPDQITGKSDYDLYPKELADKYRADDRRILNSGISEEIEESYLRDGQTFIVNTIKTPIKDASGNIIGLIGIFCDITARRRAEDELKDYRDHLQDLVETKTIKLTQLNRKLKKEAEEHQAAENELRLSEEKFRIMFEYASEAITVLDLEGRIKEINSGALRLHKFTGREELLGHNASELIAPKDRHRAKENFRQTLKGTVLNAVEFNFLTRNGNEFQGEMSTSLLKDNSGTPTSIISITRDSTARKKAEETLAVEMTRRRNLVEQSRDGIVILDADGAVYEANQQFADMLGYPLDEAQKLNVWDWEYSFTREQTMELIRRDDRKGNYFETKHRRKDGSTFDVEISTNAATFDGQKLIFCICRDVTDRKRAEEKLNETSKKMEALIEKLEEQTRYNLVLSKMRDMLNACETVPEISPIIAEAIKKLFPAMGGALFLLSPSRSDLESVAKWGDFPESVEENVFDPDSCWGLRRGSTYIVENTPSVPFCKHIQSANISSYACVPLIAKGDVLGLLHLRTKPGIPVVEVAKDVALLREIVGIVAEYLSLSVSNIKLREKLANQSIKDPLTGLYNRRYMEEAMQHEIMRADRKQSQIGVIMLDIDHFKNFNDSYGHKAGDALLVQLANFLRSSLRGSDVICRYGGEEFVIILPESPSSSSFERAEQLRQNVKTMQTHYRDQTLPSITLSMGIATYPVNGKDIDDLFNTADAALYRAKTEGRDKVVIG